MPPAHEGPIQLGEAQNLQAPPDVGLLSARFVRYPGCQQLQLWLPQPGDTPPPSGGYSELRVLGLGGALVERGPVAHRLNGSVKMLFDTLSWPPGDYQLEIDHADGWRHLLPLRKLREGEAVPRPAAAPGVEPANAAGPTVYRDGWGRVLPDEDLLLRERVLTALAQRLSRRLEYEGHFYGGRFIYVDGPLRITFDQELGAGGCKALLHMPKVGAWADATGTPLAQREEIVRFVAEAATRRIGSRYVLSDGFIEIF